MLVLVKKILWFKALLVSLLKFHYFLNSVQYPLLKGLLWLMGGSSEGKESACNVGDLGLIPGCEDPLEKG